MFKIYSQKNTTHNIRREKRGVKNKTDKNCEKIGRMYCLGCKNYTNNFKF